MVGLCSLTDRRVVPPQSVEATRKRKRNKAAAKIKRPLHPSTPKMTIHNVRDFIRCSDCRKPRWLIQHHSVQLISQELTSKVCFYGYLLRPLLFLDKSDESVTDDNVWQCKYDNNDRPLLLTGYTIISNKYNHNINNTTVVRNISNPPFLQMVMTIMTTKTMTRKLNYKYDDDEKQCWRRGWLRRR